MFLMYQERSFAARRCWLVICLSFPNTYATNSIHISKSASTSDEIIFLELYMFLMHQVRYFAARRCWLVIYLSLPNTYIANTIHISKSASTSDKYYLSYDYFPLFFHEKWRPSWIFWYFRNYFLPMSLSSSENYIKIEPVVLELKRNTQTHTHTHTLPF